MKTTKQIRAMADASGMKTVEYRAGNSPYSRFDLVLYKDGVTVGDDPCLFTASNEEVVTTDPATAYKGRVGHGRLFVATPATDGWVTVNSWDDVHLTLADGTTLGLPPAPTTLGELFPGLAL